MPLGYGFFIDGEAMAVGSGETGKGDGAMTEATLDLDGGLLFLIDRDDDGIVVQDLACACGRLEVIAFGFAMHGLKASRSASRMQELEQLTAAMSEEINQLRASSPRGLG